ncbi:hypothetical protein F5146DRAFT_1006435 [Armillaria mellea]|nr:hypothetical protein F5146DRAFT_1006435 [Armillaria mellea]
MTLYTSNYTRCITPRDHNATFSESYHQTSARESYASLQSNKLRDETRSENCMSDFCMYSLKADRRCSRRTHAELRTLSSRELIRYENLIEPRILTTCSPTLHVQRSFVLVPICDATGLLYFIRTNFPTNVIVPQILFSGDGVQRQPTPSSQFLEKELRSLETR